MAPIFTNQVIGCAAILLAGAILQLAPRWFRLGFVVVVFSAGMLAAAAGFGASLGDTAVGRLFG
jgi:hypothetical protein